VIWSFSISLRFFSRFICSSSRISTPDLQVPARQLRLTPDPVANPASRACRRQDRGPAPRRAAPAESACTRMTIPR
jgi:hypothetical protein